jgi:hypothetical protein
MPRTGRCSNHPDSRFKHELGMLPQRIWRLERVRLHVDLAILAKLGDAVAKVDGMTEVA